MTTLVRAPAPAVLGPPPGFGSRFRLAWRLLRRGALIMWGTVALYLVVEVLVFRSAYPDAAARERLLQLSASTAVRMMQGLPGAVDTAGGFAVWDAGWLLSIIVGCWAMLAATRLTRGEEDAGRAELVLCRPVTARQALAAQLAALAVACAGIAAAAALPFVVLGEPAAGAVLWGVGLGALAAVAAATAAVVAQLVEPRRRAAGAGLALLAAAFVLRVVANSADTRSWLLGLGPFGWVERLRAFSGDRWLWLLPPAGVALALGAASLAVCGRRDVGAALIRSAGAPRSSVRLLGGAARFGWRLSSGALAAWTVILAVITFVFGLMTGALVDFIEQDESYRRIMESMGVDMSVPAVGYLSYVALFLALPFAAFLGWRLGAVRTEEAEGRLDNLLVRGVDRRRWLAATALQALLAGTVLVVAAAVALWAGVALVGAPAGAVPLFEALFGTLPVVVLFTGLAVLVYGTAPRLTVAVPVTVAVLGYLLETFGTLLAWPAALVALSPFHHLAQLPGRPMTLTAIVAMVAVGVAAAAAGVAAFARRDLRSD